MGMGTERSGPTSGNLTQSFPATKDLSTIVPSALPKETHKSSLKLFIFEKTETLEIKETMRGRQTHQC